MNRCSAVNLGSLIVNDEMRFEAKVTLDMFVTFHRMVFSPGDLFHESVQSCYWSLSVFLYKGVSQTAWLECLAQ